MEKVLGKGVILKQGLRGVRKLLFAQFEFWEVNLGCVNIYTYEQEGFLRCQTPTSTLRLKVEGCRVKNGGCRIESEEQQTCKKFEKCPEY